MKLDDDTKQLYAAKLAQSPLAQSLFTGGDRIYRWSGKPVGNEFSMERFCSPIEDQLQFGTCTANTSVGACELIMKRAKMYKPGQDDLSRDFNYWWAGLLDGTRGKDCGRTVRNALRAARIYGLCRESSFAYTADNIANPPTAAAIAEAAHRKLDSFSRIPHDRENSVATVPVLKQALNDGFPVSMAITCRTWLFDIEGPRESHYAQSLGFAPDDPAAKDEGGHDVLIVGFKDTPDVTFGGVPVEGYFLVRNSWSELWGDGGYWAMPYACLADAWELWAVEGFAGYKVAA